MVACWTVYPNNEVIYCRMVRIGMRSRIACDKDIYSASVVESMNSQWLVFLWDGGCTLCLWYL
jgi:hypothetical protein